MSLDIQLNVTTAEIDINGPCTIYEASWLLGELQKIANTTPDTTFNLRGVTELDCSGLQVFLALQKTYDIVSFAGPSHAVQSMLAFLNLTSFLHTKIA